MTDIQAIKTATFTDLFDMTIDIDKVVPREDGNYSIYGHTKLYKDGEEVGTLDICAPNCNMETHEVLPDTNFEVPEEYEYYTYNGKRYKKINMG